MVFRPASILLSGEADNMGALQIVQDAMKMRLLLTSVLHGLIETLELMHINTDSDPMVLYI